MLSGLQQKTQAELEAARAKEAPKTRDELLAELRHYLTPLEAITAGQDWSTRAPADQAAAP
jgi:hypothetical protein